MITDEQQIAKRLGEIEKRLSKTTPGHWKAAPKDSKYVSKFSVSGVVHSQERTAEDNCILRVKGNTEVLGCSEWLRAKWADLDFMAEAKSDIEFLLREVKRLKELK
jgi:hypothetical protein